MFPYILPSIIPIPLGYNTKILIPIQMIKERIPNVLKNYQVKVQLNGFREGKIFFDKTNIINNHSDGIIEFEIYDQSKFSEYSGYAELSFFEVNKNPIFLSRAVLSFYSNFYHKDKKSFLSDNAYKFGAPTTIAQMSVIKKYIDAYPTILIDKERDLGETLVFINPYKRKIKSKIISFDGREINNIIINSFSAKEILLSRFLKEKESNWEGHIQLTSTNRIITFNFKHSYKDKKIISDYEHLDPYRGDPTFVPITKFVRQKIGKYLISRKY